MASAVAPSGCGNELLEGTSLVVTQTGEDSIRIAPANPAVGYFADVVANGPGCPPGSWFTDVSDDGQVFTTYFSAFEAEVSPERRESRTSCTLKVRLHSPQGLSFSMTSLYYSGFAFLEEGVRSYASASYGFRGIGTPRSSRRELVGPHEGSFVYEDRVALASGTWSRCGAQHDLTVNTELRVVNGRPLRSGYTNLSNIDGSTKVVFHVGFRTCPPTGSRQDR